MRVPKDSIALADSRNRALRGRRGLQRGNVDRERLLDVSSALFASKGYRATSLDDIAAALGIKKSSLYHYVSSKDEILIGLYSRLYELVEPRIWAIRAEPLAPDRKLRKMVEAYIELITTHIDSFSTAWLNEHELSPENRLAIQRRHRRMERTFEAVIIEGQQQGLLARHTPRLMGLAMFGMVMFIQYWYRNAKISKEQIKSEFLAILESGWKTARPEEKREIPDVSFERLENSLRSMKHELKILKAAWSKNAC
ncbi:TetR/AcrR family transcriptional regulator [Rhodoligotrophos defluvii]|uniref:TetR/AcrR family transcriptional regulator n=1 Tax=Rhodoligotrophos defluvii TaxID=2561934 RepID=UPI0010C94280|nr:TetR/AcrR family transcriptional regulator [Rhodoligotrophos defluvii]